MPLKRGAILLVLVAAVGGAGYLYFGDRDDATGGGPPIASVSVPGTLSARAELGQRTLRSELRVMPWPERGGTERGRAAAGPCHLRARPPW